MDPRQRKVVQVTVLVVLLSWAGSLWFPDFREAPAALPDATLQFDAERAYEITREFVTRFPRRVIDTFEARQSTGYIQQYLARLGYTISYMHFKALVASRTKVGRNVLAFKEGQSKQILAAVAHYDTAGTTVQGAMDNGSGVGVLLEMARIFANSPPRHSVLFVFSDGAEWGSLGALDLAQNYSERKSLAAVISLDYVAAGDLGALRLDTAGQMRGYTPPWLREVCRAALQESGLPVLEPHGLREHLDRTMSISWNDQGPFLNAGIPAANIGSNSRDAGMEKTIVHSAEDLVGHMQPSSFVSYGRAAERALRTLDGMTLPGAGSMGPFRLKDSAYLSSGLVTLLHFLTFLPFFAILCVDFSKYGKRLEPARIRWEVIEYLWILLPLAGACVSIFAFRRLRLLPRYTLYAGTLRDPVLESPRWGILYGILGTGIVLGLTAFFIRRFLKQKMPQPEFQAAKCVLMAALLAVIVIALLYNSYWAVTFLALPAWLWAAVGAGQNAGRRASNRVWILAGGLFFYLVTAHYAGELGLGWKILWYQILAISTGLFSIEGVLLGVATICVGARFVAIQSYPRRPDVPRQEVS